MTVVGCGLLAAGATLGGISKSDHREFSKVDIQMARDVDRARTLLDRAQRRARRANGLIAGGAVAAAAGAAGLIFAYLRSAPVERRALSLDLSVDRGGFGVAVGGTWGSAR